MCTEFVPVARIWYSQDSIGPKFRDGTPLQHTINKLKNKQVQPKDIPMITVARIDDIYVTADNRRLYCFQQAGIKSLKVRIEEISNIRDDKFTGRGHRTVTVRGREKEQQYLMQLAEDRKKVENEIKENQEDLDRMIKQNKQLYESKRRELELIMKQKLEDYDKELQRKEKPLRDRRKELGVLTPNVQMATQASRKVGVPKSHIGAVIGSGGAHIKLIEQTAGVKISKVVNQTTGGAIFTVRQVNGHGKIEAAAQVIQWICQCTSDKISITRIKQRLRKT